MSQDSAISLQGMDISVLMFGYFASLPSTGKPGTGSTPGATWKLDCLLVVCMENYFVHRMLFHCSVLFKIILINVL